MTRERWTEQRRRLIGVHAESNANTGGMKVPLVSLVYEVDEISTRTSEYRTRTETETIYQEDALRCASYDAWRALIALHETLVPTLLDVARWKREQ